MLARSVVRLRLRRCPIRDDVAGSGPDQRAILFFARFFTASVRSFNVATTSWRACSSAGCPSGAGSSTTLSVAFFALANCLEGILVVWLATCPDGSFRLAVENFVEAIFFLAVENLRDGIFDIEFSGRTWGNNANIAKFNGNYDEPPVPTALTIAAAVFLANFFRKQRTNG